MVGRGLIRRRAILALAGLLVACGDGGRVNAPVGNGPPPSARPPDYASDDAGWGKFYSKRFQLTVPLPQGKTWKIDDHRARELVAAHPPTSSRLQVLATQELDLMNRERCEARARAIGWVPERAQLMTVEDEAHVGPDTYDSRVWVALEAGKPGGAVDGHVFLFGALLRRCLLVHLVTTVPSAQDEEVLASRLAVASARIVKGITVDPPRTTDDAAVPRVKPDIRR